MPISIGKRENHEVERQCRIVSEMDRQDIAALHGQLIEQALRERMASTLGLGAPGDRLDHTVVFRNYFALSVKLRDQSGLTIARENEEGAGICLEIVGKHRWPIVERTHCTIDCDQFFFGLGDLVLVAVFVFENSGHRRGSRS